MAIELVAVSELIYFETHSNVVFQACRVASAAEELAPRRSDSCIAQHRLTPPALPTRVQLNKVGRGTRCIKHEQVGRVPEASMQHRPSSKFQGRSDGRHLGTRAVPL